MTLVNAFTLVVNSCDRFEDCWFPFFRLLQTHWPDLSESILLITQRKSYEHPGMAVQAARVGDNAEEMEPTWSTCLLRALEMVETPLVLYVQEDYFLNRPVDGRTVKEFASMMLSDANVKHIGLTHFGSQGPFADTEDPRLKEIGSRARYRIATQAGLWRTETLRSYLRPEENGWMFEIYGTRRAWRRSERFLTVDPDAFGPGGHPVFSYTHTGIIKGKWHPAMPELFASHGIDVDFAKRGFYHPKPPLLEKLVTLTRLARSPGRAFAGLRGR